MDTSKILLCLALTAMLGGCWNAKQEYAKYMAEGKARNVPLLIYDTSWNDPHALYNTHMAVGLLNTGDKQLNSVVLLMNGCGSKGVTDYTYPLNLSGPFLPGKAYIVYPSWPVQYSQWISREQAEAEAKTSSHMVITGIEITDGDGVKSIYNKDVLKMLTANISNFCINSIF